MSECLLSGRHTDTGALSPLLRHRRFDAPHPAGLMSGRSPHPLWCPQNMAPEHPSTEYLDLPLNLTLACVMHQILIPLILESFI